MLGFFVVGETCVLILVLIPNLEEPWVSILSMPSVILFSDSETGWHRLCVAWSGMFAIVSSLAP